jgi:hypothetical protein
MASDTPQPLDDDQSPPTADELNDADFQAGLKALVEAYQGMLEQDLKRALDTQALTEEVLSSVAACEDEVATASRIFQTFATEEVVLRVLPPEARKLLGPPDQWRWCLLHIRCCLIFGWLICRRPRNFRAFVYYLYRYWLCVRQVVGKPVSNPLTAEEHQDFQTLVALAAQAYKPYLTDQLSTVEFPTSIPDGVLDGSIDCFDGEGASAAVIERLLTVEAAQALLGRETFEKESKSLFFGFCRCWCLCAIRLGCCVAGAKNLVDVTRCLVGYRRCLVQCLRPLVCAITSPAEGECVEAGFIAACSPLVGITITGTATGAAFDHYTLQYSWGGPLMQSAVVYPGCGRPPAQTQSNSAVGGGTLGWLDVTLLPAGITAFTVQLDVFNAGGSRVTCIRDFQIKTTAVEITDAATVNALVAEDPFNLGSFTKLIKAVNNPSTSEPELSIGGAFSVYGSAYVVGCDRILSQYTLVNYAVSPLAPVPAFPDASQPGNSPMLPAPVVYDDVPGHPWQSGCFPVITPNIILNGDLVAQWAANNCPNPFPPPLFYTVPKVKALPFWDSNPRNGRYVIFLETRDTLVSPKTFPGSVAAVDQVVVWIDNQQPIGQIKSIGGVTGCGDLHLKDYVGGSAEILGVAWDPPIDPTAPQQRPNDNFGSYSLSFERNGDPLATGVIPGATPTTRVPNVWPALPSGTFGTLANWDIVAALDGGVGPLPLHSPKILRGERCAYVVVLSVSDTTHVGDSGTHHGAGPILYAINIINDIP